MAVPEPETSVSKTPSPGRDVNVLLAEAYLEIGHLETALVNARRIGAAVGIIMVRDKLTYVDAYAVLEQASQQQNVKIRDLAERVLYSGDLRV